LKIVMVSGHGCIRVHKMAIPLIEKGHEVHLVAFKASTFWEQYKTFSLCYDVEQMVEALRLHAKAGADVFHCHNEPSYFVSVLKELTKIPVILDVHDSYLARSTPEEATKVLDTGSVHIRVTAEERNNFQLADALVFPGNDFRNLVTGEFALKQPALTLPSYVPKRFYKYKTMDWHGGLVYEGRVNLPEENAKPYHTGFNYCDYTDVATRARSMEMDFHLYAGRSDEKFLKHYKDTAFIHKPLLYEELLDMVGRHDWGLVGNTTKTKEWDVAMPNKLFEYMATGVPVVAMNAADCARFVKDTGVGIAVDGPEELGSRWREHRDCRKTLFQGAPGVVDERPHPRAREVLRRGDAMNAPAELPRKERESDYWDWVAEQVFTGGQIRANIHKMEQILWRVLRAGSMIDQRVLEVGLGLGLVASTINVVLLGKWKYRATDMSPIFVKNAVDNFGFDVVRTDVTCLPGNDGEYTRVLCFDSLEHVHPEDRQAGYAELARVTAKGGLLLINMPLSEDQFHDIQFDHPFGAPDFAMLKAAGFAMKTYEAYMAPVPTKARPSAFVVFERA
jgi:SAM-dependent methyltransferase